MMQLYSCEKKITLTKLYDGNCQSTSNSELESAAASSSSSNSNSNSNPNPDSNTNTNTTPLSTGAIIGIVGLVVGVLAAVVIATVVIKKKKASNPGNLSVYAALESASNSQLEETPYTSM